jgi:hypothetical protein
VANTIDLIEALTEERLIAFSAGDGDLDDIVEFAGDEISLYDFRKSRDSTTEPLERLVVMLREGDLDEDRIRPAEAPLVQNRW